MSVKELCYLLLSFTQSGENVTWHSMFNILSPASSDFRLNMQHSVGDFLSQKDQLLLQGT